MRRAARFIVLLALFASGHALSCQYPPPPTFREALDKAANVFVFQLTQARYVRKDLGGGAYMNWVEGRIRPAQTLKGTPAGYSRIRFPTDWCGGVNLVVGHYYLVATHDAGNTIELVQADGSIIDLEGFYKPEEKKANLKSAFIAPVIQSLYAGRPLDASFPGPGIAGRTVVQAPPPPSSCRCETKD